MIGIVLFDNHDDLLYVFSDDEFRGKIQSVADSLDMPLEYGQDGGSKKANDNGVEAMVVMQMFSPLLTSYRVMNHEFQNYYDGITCEDGSTVAFYEKMNFLIVAVAKASINAVHLVRVSYSIMQHVVGPSLSMYGNLPNVKQNQFYYSFFLPVMITVMSFIVLAVNNRLKHSDTHSELTTLLLGKFLLLRQSSQPVITESLHYEPISEEANAFILQILQQAVSDLNLLAGVPESRAHILVIKETSIVAIYSG